MKLRENSLLIIYFSSFVTFFLLIFFYVPRPRLNTITPIKNDSNQLDLLKVSFDNNLSNKLKRRINIGNGYNVSLNNGISLNLIPISFWSKKEFNLSYYSEYLPELFIEADQIISLESNNYGIGKSNINKKFQACFYDFNKSFVSYEYESKLIKHRYNNYRYWFFKIINETSGLVKNLRKKNFNCLLITSNTPEIFEKEKDLIKIITNKFNYY